MKTDLFGIVLALSMTACSSTPIFGSNIHRISSGVYRTGQLENQRLENFLKITRVSHYINLRGENNEHEWYRSEVAICSKFGVQHYNIRLSAREVPDKKELMSFIDIVQNFESLGEAYAIHCNGGANRTGFGTAVILILKGYSVEKAKQRAFGLRFGHLNIGNYSVPTGILDDYSIHQNRMDFRQWVEIYYNPEIVRRD